MLEEKERQAVAVNASVDRDGVAWIFRLPSGFNNLEIEVYEDPFDLTVRYINKDKE